MAHYEWGEFGDRWYVDDDGNETPAPEMGAGETLAVAAGKQFSDLGRGLRSFVGDDVTREAQEAQRYYAPVEAESPYLSMAGEALPTLATAGIGGGGVLAGTALQAGMGALEGYLDYDPRASDGQRAAAGAVGGVLGEWGGRALGRILNMAKGTIQELAPRRAAVSEAAQQFEDLGGSTLAYQRLKQGTPAANLAQRAAQGMESATNPPTVLRETMQSNDQLFRNRAVEAVGLNPDNYDNLGPRFIDDALDNFNEAYRQVEQQARGAGDLSIGDALAERLKRNPLIKAAQVEDDLFTGLDAGILAPGEYIEARSALTDHIAGLYNKGHTGRAKRAEELLEQLDGNIGSKLSPEFGEEFARLREQYRVFNLLERPNVISDGDINVKTLNNALKSKTSGFGRTATSGGDPTNTETKSLIDLMRAADNPEFKAFRSSGTAENLALGKTMDDVGDAVTGALGGDARPALGMAGKMLAPGIIGASQKGSGLVYEGAFTPAANAMATGGGFMGRSMLDEYLYPFVGAEDERVR